MIALLIAIVRAQLWALETGSPSFGALLLQALGIPDWLDAEIVIVFAMAAGGVWVMANEGRQHRREVEALRELAERVAAVEVAIASENPSALAERVGILEARADLAERLAAVETRTEWAERVAVLEHRLDNPATRTRVRDAAGRFVTLGSTSCEAP